MITLKPVLGVVGQHWWSARPKRIGFAEPDIVNFVTSKYLAEPQIPIDAKIDVLTHADHG